MNVWDWLGCVSECVSSVSGHVRRFRQCKWMWEKMQAMEVDVWEWGGPRNVAGLVVPVAVWEVDVAKGWWLGPGCARVRLHTAHLLHTSAHRSLHNSHIRSQIPSQFRFRQIPSHPQFRSQTPSLIPSHPTVPLTDPLTPHSSAHRSLHRSAHRSLHNCPGFHTWVPRHPTSPKLQQCLSSLVYHWSSRVLWLVTQNCTFTW